MIIAGVLALLVAQAEPTGGTNPTMPRSQRLLELHRSDAEAYRIDRDADHQQKLSLLKEPVYRWTNPNRNGGQEGDVFVWTYRGRPEAVGCIFSHPERGNQRVVNHEFHSLAPVVLVVEHPGTHQWQPQAPGIDWVPLDAPPPGATHAARRVQLNALLRDFSGESHNGTASVKLRLLQHALYRYESNDSDHADGALFAYVTSAGTDPELLLLVEAYQDGGTMKWHAAGARFSDWGLGLKYKGKGLWSSPEARIGGYDHDEKHRYRFYRQQVIDEIVEPLSRRK